VNDNLCHDPSKSSHAAPIIAVAEGREDEKSKQKEFEPRMTRINPALPRCARPTTKNDTSGSPPT